jgi:hypothetical protein
LFYPCLILTSISHLKALFNLLLLLILLLLLLSIIYTINLPVVRPRSCRLFITSTLLHLGEDINLLVVSVWFQVVSVLLNFLTTWHYTLTFSGTLQSFRIISAHFRNSTHIDWNLKILVFILYQWLKKHHQRSMNNKSISLM